jgi:hypothetical protein
VVPDGSGSRSRGSRNGLPAARRDEDAVEPPDERPAPRDQRGVLQRVQALHVRHELSKNCIRDARVSGQRKQPGKLKRPDPHDRVLAIGRNHGLRNAAPLALAWRRGREDDFDVVFPLDPVPPVFDEPRNERVNGVITPHANGLRAFNDVVPAVKDVEDCEGGGGGGGGR